MEGVGKEGGLVWTVTGFQRVAGKGAVVFVLGVVGLPPKVMRGGSV